MNKYLLKKHIFAVIFIVTVVGFSVVNFLYSYESLEESIISEGISASMLDTAITENMYGRMNFIETYSFVQALMNKRESDNFSYVMDENGYLHYASFYREDDERIFECSMRVKRLNDYAESVGTKVLFVIPPSKYDKDSSKFRTGIPVNDPGNTVDELLFYLNRLGVETLDLRDSFPNEELTYEETFFKTDHHWTIPAAFYATNIIVDKMNECFGANLDPTGYYTDINNYEAVTYKSGMLGSMGRKTGVNFCEVEDFTALWPHFEGKFTREYMEDDGEMEYLEGSFTETLMDLEVLTDTTDIYLDSQYSVYLDSLRVYESLVNEENPDGCSIFMIRDSYFSPVMTFMIPMCSRIDAIWLLEDTKELDIESYMKENTFDYVIIELMPYNIDSSAFNFFKKEV